MPVDLVAERLSNRVISAFYTVYNKLRYGYLEQVYVGAMAVELRRSGLRFKREHVMSVSYEGEVVGWYRADLVVEDVLVVEVKAGRALDESARWQTLNYLRTTGLELALLLHFGPSPKFHRIVASRERARHGEDRPRVERSS